jgi:PAS domain S-box-containing protein
LAAILFGLVSLTGWAFGLRALTSVIPGAVQMKANTGLGIALCGVCLLILADRAVTLNLTRTAQILSAAVLSLALATLAEYFFGRNFGIDEFLVKDSSGPFNVFHGRMSPFSAVAFVAISVSLALMPYEGRSGATRAGAAVTILIGLVSLLGYLWNASELITDRWLPPVAANTATCFVLLGAGVLLSPRRRDARLDVRIAALAAVEIKILAGFIAALSLLLIGGSYTYRANVQFADSAEWVAHSQQVRASVASLYGSLAGAEVALRDFVLTTDAAHRSEYDRLVDDVQRHLRDLEFLTRDNAEQQKNIASLRPLVAARLESMASAITAHANFGLPAARAIIALGRDTNATQDVHALTERLDTFEARLLARRQAATEGVRRTTLISLLLTLAAASGLFFVLFRGIRREMRARREAEGALRASEQYNRSIVDSSPDCLCVLTLEGRLSQMTPQGRRLMDIDDFSAVANSDWLQLWNSEALPAAQSAVDAARAGTNGRFHGYSLTLEGIPKWWDVIVMPIRDAEGRPERLLAVARDISEPKRAERAILELNGALQAKAAQLESTNHELESFSYSVSHDLRAPLRAIDGFALMLEEDYSERLDIEGRRYLSVIRENGKRMAALIDDLLAFSRLGRLPLVSHEVNVETLVREVIGEILSGHGAAEAQDKPAPQIEIGPLPAARGDRTLLRQVWTNLISNAIKYSSKAAQPLIEVSGCRQGAENLYSVRDNGVGFNMQYAEKLFGVFQRLHRADEFSGTGVGLAIVHRVVTRHGGRVWAEGKVDNGAIFSFALPTENQGG